MANKKQTRRGTIQKVVHVEIPANEPVAEVRSEDVRQGYGLVRGEDGQDVFFTDNAVRDTVFAELQVGQSVDFQVEEGPLMRADCVRIPKNQALKDNDN